MINKLILFNMLTTLGFTIPDAQVMVCIAKYESGLRIDAINKDLNDNNSIDYGLFQINDRFWMQTCNTTPAELLTAHGNIRCAKKVFERQGFNAWIAYKKYKQTCDNYKVFKREEYYNAYKIKNLFY